MEHGVSANFTCDELISRIHKKFFKSNTNIPSQPINGQINWTDSSQNNYK